MTHARLNYHAAECSSFCTDADCHLTHAESWSIKGYPNSMFHTEQDAIDALPMLEEMRFQVWECDLNLGYKTNLSDGRCDFLLGERINLWAAFALKQTHEKHDHAIWVVDKFRGGTIVDDMNRYQIILTLEEKAIFQQQKAESFSFCSVNKRIEGSCENPEKTTFADKRVIHHGNLARAYLFQIVGDGCSEEEIYERMENDYYAS